MHLLQILSTRKGKTDANVQLRHSVKVDTTMKAPVHHRKQIDVTFLSPLLTFEVLSLVFWLVGLAGVAQWQDKCTKDMMPVRPFNQPMYVVAPNSTAALAGWQPKADTSAYAPSYEWFIIWSTFASACYMLYVTVFRASLWQHACAMIFSGITTAVSISHCYYISYLVQRTSELVYSKDAQNSVKALFAGMIGWTLMNILAIGWMCLDIDYDIALDEATKQLAVQQDELASRAPSRVFASPITVPPLRPAPLAPPRVGSYNEVDRVLDEVLEEGGNDGSLRGNARW